MSDGSHRDRSDDSGGDHSLTRPGNPSPTRPGDRFADRADQLLLARVSEAAGRARLGRRQATYGAPVTGPGGRGAAVGVVRRLLGAAARQGLGHVRGWTCTSAG